VLNLLRNQIATSKLISRTLKVQSRLILKAKYEGGLRGRSSQSTMTCKICTGYLWLLLFSSISLVYAADKNSVNPDLVAKKPMGQSGSATTGNYVGAKVCQGCHTEEYEDWQGSHHDLAMQPANEKTVLGNFQNTSFTYNQVTSKFFRRGQNFLVSTDNADGELKEFPIAFTFGVYPLQQYLIAFPDGRLQALGIAWDSRPAQQGGQRWFHLYPDEDVDHKHRLHWTAPDQNWNYMCAECHSTQLEKNYDFATNRFDTQYQAINVACEACHGPGSAHVDWMAESRGELDNQTDKGLIVLLDERKGSNWLINAVTKIPQRSKLRETSREIDTCARCHSRRGILSENYVAGKPIGNTHRVNLLEDGLYHADGQPADETYVYGSFLQSKMFHQGVTCSDCHNPHSLDLKLPGDQVCAQCHVSDEYATKKHHFHPLSSDGARCASCHMPVTRFMGVDDRHDHSFRIPRPDISAALGSPDACLTCHNERSHSWASEEIQKRYPESNPGFQADALTLHRARQGDPQVLDDLLGLAEQQSRPLMFRATAVTLLVRFPSKKSLTAIKSALRDEQPLVRRAAAEAMGSVPSVERLLVLPPLLQDEVLDVRLAAAVSLASTEIRQSLNVSQKLHLDKVLDTYIRVQSLNADRAEAWFNLGVLKEKLSLPVESEAAYRKALSRDNNFTPATANLYNLLVTSQRESDASNMLETQIKRQPDAAALFLIQGLQQVRKKQYAAARAALEKAAELDTNSPRPTYLLATLLFNQGELDTAFNLLEENLSRHPYDYDSLYAIVSFAQSHGRVSVFQRYQPKLEKFSSLR